MNIKSFLLMILVFTVVFPLSSQDVKRKSMNVTVYNNDLGVIREVRDIQVAKGVSEVRITDVAEKIDPTSVHIKLDADVLEQNYQYDLVSFGKILEKYIDREVTLIGDEVITGTLLSVGGSNIVLKKKDSGLVMLPKMDEYRISVGSLPDGLITRPTLIWTLESRSAGKKEAEISYQTRGMDWHAEYVAVLNEDDTRTDLGAWVSVKNNSGTTYNNANLKLVAGDVNKVEDRILRAELSYTDGEYKSKEQFEEKAFFEYHIYNLQRPATVANNEIKQISLFNAEDVKIKKKYYYKSNRYGSGTKVSVIVEFENSKKNKLGMPMPAGKVRLYKSDGESMEFVGEDMVDHTPRNEKIKLKVGDAFDIVAETVEKSHKRISKRVNEYTYEIKIRNRKEEKVVVEVERNLGLNWEILNESIKHEEKDARIVVFKVPVKADSETILTFKVRYSN